MPVEKTEWEIGTLIGAISHGEIKLPEIQRGFVWKPTQVAKLIDSLYRGYPTGSLLFWRTTESPLARDFARRERHRSRRSSRCTCLTGSSGSRRCPAPSGADEATEIVFNVGPRPSRTRARQPRGTRSG